MFRFNDDVDQSQVTSISEALSTLPGAIEQIKDYRHGADLGINDGNFDYVVVADFASVDDYLVYRDHPVHQDLIKAHIIDHVAARAAVQYHIGN